ncbi:hypothetical protein V12B01_26099 [Vibrio splendidus 12B01]|nr:hypothetical protein V12B01_26099 [Vibrio splendidus 12B01]
MFVTGVKKPTSVGLDVDVDVDVDVGVIVFSTKLE